MKVVNDGVLLDASPLLRSETYLERHVRGLGTALERCLERSVLPLLSDVFRHICAVDAGIELWDMLPDSHILDEIDNAFDKSFSPQVAASSGNALNKAYQLVEVVFLAF